ncbi:MAG: 30S ribosomal protein THX [Gammaproteobacteria bacterium]|nr:30S ribosomal protein THX [Gammaproteobacteria bacterium]
MYGTRAVLFARAKAVRDSFHFSIHTGAPHMGKGDVRTRRGKINRGTFGNARRRKKEGKPADGSRTP